MAATAYVRTITVTKDKDTDEWTTLIQYYSLADLTPGSWSTEGEGAPDIMTVLADCESDSVVDFDLP